MTKVGTRSTLRFARRKIRKIQMQCRNLGLTNRRLREAMQEAATELRAVHYPEWSSAKAKADGKDPIGCATCGGADGSWPCTSRMVADDLWLP